MAEGRTSAVELVDFYVARINACNLNRNAGGSSGGTARDTGAVRLSAPGEPVFSGK